MKDLESIERLAVGAEDERSEIRAREVPRHLVVPGIDLSSRMKR